MSEITELISVKNKGVKEKVSILVKYVPPNYKNIARNVSNFKVSAIKLHCLDCVGYERKEVALCTSWGLVLYIMILYWNKLF